MRDQPEFLEGTNFAVLDFSTNSGPTRLATKYTVANLPNPAGMIGQLCANLLPFPFASSLLKGHMRCSKDYDSPRGLCIVKISDVPRVCGLVQQLEARLLRPPFF